MLNLHRQMDIFNPEEYDARIVIVGAGAIGSSTAEALVRMGFNHITLIDDDMVKDHNLPNQLYFKGDLDKYKVQALRDKLWKINEECHIDIIPTKLDKDTMPDADIIISAVDNMETRKEIYKLAKAKKYRLLVDGRMGGQVFQIHTINLNKRKHQKIYETTLYTDQEAVEERCTEKAIIYNVFIIGGYIVNNIKKVMKDEKYPITINWDLVNNILRSLGE